MKKKCISLLVCAALIFTMLFALPMTTAQAADDTLTVTHSTSGNLAAEINASLWAGATSTVTKIKVNIGSVDLNGSGRSGDWLALYDLNNTLPHVVSLELNYTSGSHVIPNYALNDNDINVGCSWLRTLTITTSVGQLTGIGIHAFDTCVNLNSISLPNSAVFTSIGEAAFSGCSGLSGTLTIPASVQSIGLYAFSSCTGLSALSFPDTSSLTTLANYAFSGCSGLDGTLTFPSSLQSIGAFAFYGCSGLDALSLPKTGSLTSIGVSAFLECTELKDITLPDSLQTIGSSAFVDCSKLSGTLVIPASVTSIGTGVFFGCPILDALVFKNTSTAPTMAYSIADNTQIVAYFPAAAQSSYIAQIGLPANRIAYDDNTALITSFNAGSARGTIDQIDKTITLDLPEGTNPSSLSPQIGFIGSALNPASGSAQDFSSSKKIYTVTPVSGSPVGYDVYVRMQPAVSGNNQLSGTVGNVGDQTVFALVSGSFAQIIMPKASIGGNEDIGLRVGNGRVAFFFSDFLLNGLAVGCYPITVSMDASAGNKAIASTQIGTLTVKPLAPTMKTVTAANSSVTVNWNAVAGANGYKVYSYNPTTKAYTEIAGTAGTSYTQTGRAANTTYAYAVRSYQTVGGTPIYSDYSTVASAKTPLPVIGIPSGFKAVSASYNSIKLTWSAVSGATNYVVSRATAAAGPYTQLTSAATSSGYTNTGLKSGTTYYYKIKAYAKVNGTTVYGKETAVVSAKPIPSAPGAMKAVKASATSITITWGAVSGATKYEVYRATASGGKYTLVNTTTGKSFTNKKLAKGKTYYYKVCAIRMEGKTKVTGAYSVIVNIKL
jgi:fibronectin type 3 domain-containing protein